MESSSLKALPLFITWQHVQKLTKQGETKCRLELNRHRTRFGVSRLTIYQLCEAYGITRDQMQAHLCQ